MEAAKIMLDEIQENFPVQPNDNKFVYLDGFGSIMLWLHAKLEARMMLSRRALWSLSYYPAYARFDLGWPEEVYQTVVQMPALGTLWSAGQRAYIEDRAMWLWQNIERWATPAVERFTGREFELENLWHHLQQLSMALVVSGTHSEQLDLCVFTRTISLLFFGSMEKAPRSFFTPWIQSCPVLSGQGQNLAAGNERELQKNASMSSAVVSFSRE